jgi:peptidoglycan/xylan/chitin deacetylase (PgdA/CDA1 family)
MKKIVVTTSWDDGHILDLKLSNLLTKYNIKGTFYISPKDREIKEKDRLTPDQILKVAENFEIGAHTMTHPSLTMVSDEVAKEEIVHSKNYLESVLNKKVNSFCYPRGSYYKKHKSIVKDAGFKVARTVKRYAEDTGKDEYEIPTTVQAYRHFSDAKKILKEVGPSKFVKSYLNWDVLSTTMFDKVLKKGGVFHLWGHSWEIEKNNDWNRLEKVLQYISNHPKVKYVTNFELL